MLKIFTSKPWRSTHHTLGHVATAAWQVFPRQCFHLVLLPVIDLIHYLTFLLPPLETQQAHKLHLPICPASVFPRTCLVLLIRRQSKRKVIQWTTSSRLATLFRTNRKSDVRSVKNFLRSVNCISLVGHGLSIQRDNTNCKTRILKRWSRFIAGFFGKALPCAQFSC